MEHDDDMRWLIALISDTGMRLAEAADLHIDDIKLDELTKDFIDQYPLSYLPNSFHQVQRLSAECSPSS